MDIDSQAWDQNTFKNTNTLKIQILQIQINTSNNHPTNLNVIVI